MKHSRINRVTLIGDEGTIFDRYDLDSVDLEAQDGGKTLKIRITGDTKENPERPPLFEKRGVIPGLKLRVRGEVT